MTSLGPHKRKLSGGAEQGSSRIPNWEPGSLADQADDERFRRLYQHITTSGSARSHLGDTRANTVNYNFGPSSVDSTADNQRWENFRRALSFDRMEFRRRAIEPAYGNTCRWVLETEEYLRWRDETFRDEHHGFLWIKGKPGAGKSTIMKFLLEHAQRNMTDHTILSFFFNARGTSLETSAEGLYRSLLLQLLEAVPRLRGTVNIPNLDPKHVWEVKIVQDFFREALLHSSGLKVIIFIDALDEGEQKDVRDMVAYFARIAANARSNDVPFEVCFASRHYPTITTSHRVELIVESQKHHAHDIRSYVAETLNSDLTAQSNDLVHNIVGKSQNVFLWAVLVVRMLNEEIDKGSTSRQLLSILDKIPEDLDDLLSAILLKGAPDKYFLPSMQWMLAARLDTHGSDVSFSVPAFYFGILLGASEVASPVWNRTDIDLAAMQRFIVHSTKGLVEWPSIEDDDDGLFSGDIQFIHESVRQHLLNGGLTKVFPFLGNKILATSHAKLAEWCQTYLRMIHPENMDVPLNPTTGMVAVDMFEDSHEERWRRICAKFLLIHYIMQHTLLHMMLAHPRRAFDLATFHNFPKKAWINLNAIYSDRRRWPPSASALDVAIEMSFDDLAQTLSVTFKRSLSQTETEMSESGTEEQHDNVREPSLGGLILGERIEEDIFVYDDADATQEGTEADLHASSSPTGSP